MIQVDALTKTFDRKIVLNKLSFKISPGEIFGLLGPNGSGKTTTIKILCNLLDADSGDVYIMDKSISPETKYILGIAPQEISVYKDLTCKENLHFFAQIYGLDKPQTDRRIAELIEFFQLAEYTHTPISEMSGGWQRRLNIAVALVHSPTVLILDEPTAGLDVEARFELWRLIEELKGINVTLLLTTHYLEEAERLCSRIGILQQGRLVAEGTLPELYQRIPAVQLAAIETDREESVLERARSLGWESRDYGGKLTFWLPRLYTIKDIVSIFDGIPLSSVSLREVGLEQVYLELTRNVKSYLGRDGSVTLD